MQHRLKQYLSENKPNGNITYITDNEKEYVIWIYVDDTFFDKKTDNALGLFVNTKCGIGFVCNEAFATNVDPNLVWVQMILASRSGAVIKAPSKSDLRITINDQEWDITRS